MNAFFNRPKKDDQPKSEKPDTDKPTDGQRNWPKPPPVRHVPKKPAGERPEGSNPRPPRGPRPEGGGRPNRRNRGQGRPDQRQDRPRNGMSTMDNRDSGMLYPGSQMMEKPKAVRSKDAKLRVIPMGGLGEIGMNCTAIEYGDDIVIVDMGFMFPDETLPGVDYVLPDVSYLEGKKKNIRGILVTHAHLDHIGGAPWLLPKLGYPPVYATKLTEALIKSNIEEHRIEKNVEFRRFKYDDKVQLGVFSVEFFHINHNIPEGVGMAITTPVGVVTHSGDFKFDETPIADDPAEFDKIRKIGDKGVLLAMNDSTNVEVPGHTKSEVEIGKELANQVGQAKGRVIMSTFASLIARLQEAIDAAQANGRKVSIVGRSMIKNVEICQRLGYIKIPKDILVDPRQIKKYRDNEILIICTGSQATEYSALLRMSAGENKQVQIKQGDTVILSSSPVPGNERAVEGMMDDLFRKGADVIYSKLFDIHTSGHAYQDELREMLELLRPQHFMPVHGEFRKRVLHGRLAVSTGVKPGNIHLLDNGYVLEANHRGTVGLTKEKVGGGLVLVDGLGVGDVGNTVLRERKHMSEDGMFVIIATIGKRDGRFIDADLISRGFTYMQHNKELMRQAHGKVRQIAGGKQGKRLDAALLKNRLRDEVGELLFKKTERRPMVLPVIIEV
jgi:ribonuclease J